MPLTTISDMPRKAPIATAWTTKLIHPTRSAPEGFRSLTVPTGCGSRPSSGIAVVSGARDMEARLYGIVGRVFRRISATVDTATPDAAMDRLRLFRMGLSWGGVASLVLTPDLEAAAYAKEYGDRLVRFYVGLEDPDDLIADLESAFSGTPGLSIT